MRRHRSYWLRDPLTLDRFFFGALQRLLQPGDVVYDVGSNIGLYVRFLVQQFQASRVIAFEPMTDTFKLLQNNVAKNADVAAKTTLFNLALADVESEEQFQIDDMSSASSTLNRVTGGAPSTGRLQYGLPPKTQTVKVLPLDLVIARHNCPPPKLIKIDVEGAGGLVLQGARQTMLNHRPDLLVETHSTEEAATILRTLKEYGYHCFGHVNRSGEYVYAELNESDVKPMPGEFWQPHQFAASVDAQKLREEIKPYHALASR